MVRYEPICELRTVRAYSPKTLCAYMGRNGALCGQSGTLLGYEVVTASHGAEGLELFHRLRPDCVIVDVQMPVMNGFQFLRAIRGDPASAHVPVIILSVRNEEVYQRTAAYSGVDEYMPKPFKLSALCATIERVTQITPEERVRRQQRLADEVEGGAG